MCVFSNYICKFNRFVCSNGQCFNYKWVCDSDLDCSNGFDENQNMCGEQKNQKLYQVQCVKNSNLKL